MAAIDFDLWVFSPDIWASEPFNMLREFLQPGSRTAMADAVEWIEERVEPTHPDPDAENLYTIVVLMVEMSRQIPPEHPSMGKLAALALNIFGAPGCCEDYPAAKAAQARTLSVREAEVSSSRQDTLFDVLTEEDGTGMAPHRRANCVAFASLVCSPLGYFPGAMIPQFRLALEDGDPRCASDRETWTAGCAQIMISAGGEILERIICRRRDKPAESDEWRPGELYANTLQARGLWEPHRTTHLTLDRWRYWRAEFLRIASGERDSLRVGEERVFSQDTRDRCARAAERMKAVLDATDVSEINAFGDSDDSTDSEASY